MPIVTTGDLLKQLKAENISYSQYLEGNSDSFVQKDIVAYWENVLSQYKMKKIDIINKSDVGYTFFYDIINGKKIPSRDTICKIHLGLHASLESCQATLKFYDWAQLHPKTKRDSILIYGIEHSLSVNEVHNMLIENEEKPFKQI